jgi:hypothetical protein
LFHTLYGLFGDCYSANALLLPYTCMYLRRGNLSLIQMIIPVWRALYAAQGSAARLKRPDSCTVHTISMYVFTTAMRASI